MLKLMITRKYERDIWKFDEPLFSVIQIVLFIVKDERQMKTICSKSEIYHQHACHPPTCYSTQCSVKSVPALPNI